MLVMSDQNKYKSKVVCGQEFCVFAKVFIGKGFPIERSGQDKFKA